MGMVERLVKDTEPCVQRFHEPYGETHMGPQGPAGVGLCVSIASELNNSLLTTHLWIHYSSS